MRRIVVLLAAALLVVAAGTAAALADGGTPPTAPPTATVHLAGTVTAVGSSSLSLQVQKASRNASSLEGRTVTIAVDSGTEITVGKDPGRLSDIKAGARAAVMAKGFPDNLTATKIHAGKGEGQGEHEGEHAFGGSVTAVGSGSLTLQVEKTGNNDSQLMGQSVTVAVTSSTEITLGKDKTPIPLSQVQVGYHAGVAAKQDASGAWTADRIRVSRGDHHFGGAVTTVGSGSLTIHVDKTGKNDTQLMGQTLTLAVTSSTQITLGKDKTPIPLGQILVGYRAGVSAHQDASGAWTADRIHAGYGDHWFAGTVAGVGSGSITVNVLKTGPHDPQLNGQTVTVPVDSSTQIVKGKDKTPITLADVKTGDRVGIVVHAPGGDLSQGMTAVRIHDWGQKESGSSSSK